MPGRSLTVISVKSALYFGLLGANEVSPHTPAPPRLGSMYQKVSIISWCRPVDWPPALIAQMLNQPAFLIVPSGFSTISVSLRGRLEIVFCADTSLARQPTNRSSAIVRQMRIVGFSHELRRVFAC